MITTSQTGFLTKNRHFLKRNEQIKAKLKINLPTPPPIARDITTVYINCQIMRNTVPTVIGLSSSYKL